MIVKLKKLSPTAIVPQYKTKTAAAADLYACLCSDITVLPNQRAKIPTGIAIEAQREDICAVICARSGLSYSAGISLANGIGVIDSDYRGEIIVSVINNSDSAYTIKHGERIAQLMFIPIISADFILSDSLSDTERGAGGFGSTGKN